MARSGEREEREELPADGVVSEARPGVWEGSEASSGELHRGKGR